MLPHAEIHETYTKINTLYMRDTKGKTILGEFSRPEFKYLYDVLWLAFEKVDGTNLSCYWDGHDIQYHGKTENYAFPPQLLAKMQELLPMEKLAKVFPLKYDENGNEIPFIVKIYGEGYGDKIQKHGNRYIKNDVNFTVFDIKINDFWLEWDSVVDICNKLEISHVVPFGELTLREAEKMVKKGFKSPISEDKELFSEGLVLRPLVQFFNRKGERVMVKIKTCDYRKLGILE